MVLNFAQHSTRKSVFNIPGSMADVFLFGPSDNNTCGVMTLDIDLAHNTKQVSMSRQDCSMESRTVQVNHERDHLIRKHLIRILFISLLMK